MTAPAAGLTLVPFTASVARYTATEEKRWVSTSTLNYYHFRWDRVEGLQLKFGPGKAWMMAKPSRKSREDTQPSSTTYLHGLRDFFTQQLERLLTLEEGE